MTIPSIPDRKGSYCIIVLLFKDNLLAKNTLTAMLLVTNLANYKMMQKSEKVLNPWHMGTHLRVLSESYLMNTNMTGFGWFSKDFASLCFGHK